MNSTDAIEQTVKYVRNELYGEASGHDWWHTFRVWQLAKCIARHEGADMVVVELSALLHDISDSKLNGGDTELGAKMAREWLINMHVEPEVVEHVVQIVHDISFRGAGVTAKPMTLEEGVVQDADRLDAMGAIGIARAFAFGGYKGDVIYDPAIAPKPHQTYEEYKNRKSTSINHFYEKLLLIKDLMNTDAARRLAEHRHSYMEEFLNEFYSEWNALDIESTIPASI